VFILIFCSDKYASRCGRQKFYLQKSQAKIVQLNKQKPIKTLFLAWRATKRSRKRERESSERIIHHRYLKEARPIHSTQQAKGDATRSKQKNRLFIAGSGESERRSAPAKSLFMQPSLYTARQKCLHNTRSTSDLFV
jgi:hypothetical protein